MNTTAAGIELWKERFESVYRDFRRYGKKALKFKDEEDLHQARVSGRKLLTWLKVLEVPADHPVHAGVKKAMKRMGKVRDADVLILAFRKRKKAAQDAAHKKAIKRFIAVQKEQRKRHRRRLAAKWPDILDRTFEENVKTFLREELEQRVREVDVNEKISRLEHEFRERRRRYTELREHRSPTDEETLKAMHDWRLTVKNLRYALNDLDFALGAERTEDVRSLKRLQKRLGEINDCRVWIGEWEKNRSAPESEHADAEHDIALQLKDELAEKLLRFRS